MEQLTHSSLSEYYNNFEWVRGKTPLSSIEFPVIASVIYLLVIFGIKNYKTNKAPSDVNQSIVAHNAFLIVISAAIFFGTIYELLKNLMHGATMFDLFCDPNRTYAKGGLWFWTYVYYLSKYYEFVDTLFIVLKKRELIFLHWYHHLLVVALTYVGMDTFTTNQWGAVLANSFIHILMYYYYMVTAMGKTVWWKKYLTTMQMIQFWYITAALVGWFLINSYMQPIGCSGELWSWFACLFGQVSFFVLFKRFYNKTYTKKSE